MWVEKTLQEDGPISRRLVFDEVVKAKTWKVTDDYWKLGLGKTWRVKKPWISHFWSYENDGVEPVQEILEKWWKGG